MSIAPLPELTSALERLTAIIRVLEKPSMESWDLVAEEFARVAALIDNVVNSREIEHHRPAVVDIVKLMQRAALLLTSAKLFYEKGFSPESYAADGSRQIPLAPRLLMEC